MHIRSRRKLATAWLTQTCTNTETPNIPPGLEFVDKLKLAKDMFLLLIWPFQIQLLPVGERLDLGSRRYM